MLGHQQRQRNVHSISPVGTTYRPAQDLAVPPSFSRVGVGARAGTGRPDVPARQHSVANSGVSVLRQTMYSRIEPMKKVARALGSHRELILNWFKAKKRFSSGIVGGLNNKTKLTMRKHHGVRSPIILEIPLYHALVKLPEPEPELAHEFY